MAMIEAKNLCKSFKVFKRPDGIVDTLRSLVVRNYEIKDAVKDISFEISEGELVGIIGANGAGKSTTIKMLSGILVPSSGNVVVDGKPPYENRKENALKIGTVFGQRSQLNWDLPMVDAFELYKRMYHIEDALYKHNVDRFVDLLNMEDFLRKPVRQLSLGQKMRAEIAIAMLHSPKILYLDEPTIGLDVLVKDKIRLFAKELNKEQKTTVLLTTHDMKDIDTICNRIIMIDHGYILRDMSLKDFKEENQESYYVRVEYEKQNQELNYDGIVCISEESNQKLYKVDKRKMDINVMLHFISEAFVIKSIDIRMEEIEEIVKKYMKINKDEK